MKDPFAFIEDCAVKGCSDAVLRFVDRVCMERVKGLINSIPENIGVLGVMTMIQKAFYVRLLQIRLEKLQKSVPASNI